MVRALLMPGNSSPTPPAAPSLPGPRRHRPTHWRLVAVVALAVLLVAAAVPTASAYEETFTDSNIISKDYTCTAGEYAGTLTNGNYLLRFSNIEYWPDLKVVYVRTERFSFSNLTLAKSQDSIQHYVDFIDSGTNQNIGHGYLAYNIFYDGNGNPNVVQFWVEFEEWDITSLAGSKEIRLQLNPDSPLKQFNFVYYRTGDPNTDRPIVFGAPPGTGGGAWNIEGYYIVNSQYDWTNRITITDDRLILLRDRNYSKLTIQTGENVYQEESYDDRSIYINPPINWTVTNLYGTSFTGTYAGDDPEDPDDNSTLTVYVRNSQTGALLTNANLSILAATGGTETEIINATLPGGTGTYDLEKADYLKYHATATAPGYTLLSPIIFGVPEGGTTIILWMAPDAPPEVPTEPEKSMLYGYILTQGSQQPISGATVSLDGYGSTTTSSTGFYLFNNVTPGSYSISASAPLHDALSEPVTVDSAPTQHNLALKGHYLLTITVKDGDTLANVQNATISLSDGQESTSNPVTFNGDYGPYTITAAASGYYPQTQSAYLDKPGTTTATVLLTPKPEPVPPPEMPNYPPHNVKFTVQTLLGTPISGVSVTAQGIQQTPSTNILERLLGLNMTSTPITTELMSGTTDSNGEINFMMIEAVKYQITIKKPGVVDQTLEIYPKEDTYPIIISTAGGPLLPDAGDPLRDIHINITTSTEGDIGHIHIDYNDTTRKTTGLTIQVTQQNATDSSAPEDVIATYTVANDANVTHTFDLLDYKGQSFFVRLEAEHPDFGTINRDYAVAFKGVRVPLGPLPDGLYIYVAGFGLMLLGGIFGATSATRGVVVIAFAGWLFYAFGWLDDLGLIAPVSLGLVSTIAVMGVIVTRYREEGYQ